MTTRRRVLISLAALPLVPGCVNGVPAGQLVPPPEGDDDDSAWGDDDDSAFADDDDSAVADDDDSAEPDPPAFALGVEDRDAFPSAVQTTDAKPDSVLVGLRSIEPQVVLRLGRVTDAGVELLLDSPVLESPDGIFSAELTDLEPDTRYALFAMDPSGARRSEVGRFRTALAAGATRSMTVAVTSCLGRLGAPWRSMEHVAALEPDVCLLLGDTVYADGATSLDDYRGAWDEALETDGLRAMHRATSVIATWDDHEVDNNWSWDNQGDRVEAALSAFREALPQREGPDPGRVYRSLQWGDAVEFIVLDCRADRLDGRYIGEAQMAWLLNLLSTSTASLKIILNSVPIIDFSDWIGNISADDRWQGHPDDRGELLEFLEGEDIPGVLFLGGDMHFGSICRVSPLGQPGGNHYEVMAGPGGSFINPIAYLPPNNPQYELVVGEWNTVLLSLDPFSGTVGVSFLDDAGDVIDERAINVS